ncbi:MAG: hypothetical protein JXM69_10795 [Anaerolineae bacterium]|nr:hypothetical protein [Anaerolineae bacterium]
MPLKQTAWLFVKALMIGGLIDLLLTYLTEAPADTLMITQHFVSIVFW